MSDFSVSQLWKLYRDPGRAHREDPRRRRRRALPAGAADRGTVRAGARAAARAAAAAHRAQSRGPHGARHADRRAWWRLVRRVARRAAADRRRGVAARTRSSGRSAQLGLDKHVTFLGFVPDADLPRYYQAADVFVLPTRELEGFGLVTAEALACGTPVLGTPVGATPELLEPLDAATRLPATPPPRRWRPILAPSSTGWPAIPGAGPRGCARPAVATPSRGSAGSTSSTSSSGALSDVAARRPRDRPRAPADVRGVRRHAAALRGSLYDGPSVPRVPAAAAPAGWRSLPTASPRPSARVPRAATRAPLPARSRSSRGAAAMLAVGRWRERGEPGPARSSAGRRLWRRPPHGGGARASGWRADRHRSLARGVRGRRRAAGAGRAGRRRRAAVRARATLDAVTLVNVLDHTRSRAPSMRRGRAGAAAGRPAGRARSQRRLPRARGRPRARLAGPAGHAGGAGTRTRSCTSSRSRPRALRRLVERARLRGAGAA